MSENTLNGAIRRLGYSGEEMTSHGFRSMASTLLNEQGVHPDLIELQLVHAERNSVRAAYIQSATIGRKASNDAELGRLPGQASGGPSFGSALETHTHDPERPLCATRPSLSFDLVRTASASAPRRSRRDALVMGDRLDIRACKAVDTMAQTRKLVMSGPGPCPPVRRQMSRQASLSLALGVNRSDTEMSANIGRGMRIQRSKVPILPAAHGVNLYL
jgi:hypothetical protein